MQTAQRTHALIAAALAALLATFANPASAGTVEDAAAAYGRGDNRTMLARIAEVKSADWVALQLLVAQLGGSLYGEIAYQHLTSIRPDPAQPVAAAAPKDSPRPRILQVKADASCAVAMSFYTGREDHIIKLWSLPSGAPLASAPLASSMLNLALSPHYLVIGGLGTIRVYDTATGVLIGPINTRQFGTATLGFFFSEDGKQLFVLPVQSFNAEGAGRLFDAATGDELPGQTIVLPAVRRGIAAPECPFPKQMTFSR